MRIFRKRGSENLQNQMRSCWKLDKKDEERRQQNKLPRKGAKEILKADQSLAEGRSEVYLVFICDYEILLHYVVLRQ